MTSYHQGGSEQRSLVIRDATTIDGAHVDITVEDGRVARIDPCSGVAPEPTRPTAPTCDDDGTVPEIDAAGSLVLAAAAEPHAHLDKALLAQRVVNETEDLPGAIDAIIAAFPTMTSEDVARRARAALRLAVAAGYTAVRTHADCRWEIGTSSVRALAALRAELADVVDLQIVALAGPLTDPEHGRENRDLLLASLEAGADLVGGCPSLEPEPERSLPEFFAIAREYGRSLDLHLDETTDAGTLVLRDVARYAIDHGWDLPITASHCVSLGQQDAAVIGETARLVAEAGIGVVTLPQTNLYLQGRGVITGSPRGLTAIDALRAAGATVAAGGDNWRDPFNPLGRIDPMETASLMVSAGHQRIAAAYRSVSDDARAVMGLEPASPAPGSVADLLLIEGASLQDAIAGASQQRTVIKGGRVVAQTVLTQEWY